MNVKFRKATKRDLGSLNELVNDSDVSKYLSLIPPVSMKSTLKFYQDSKKKGNQWYCILADGQIAGSTSLIPEAKNTKRAHVAEFGIAISKEYWEMGLGTKAIRFITKLARKMGIKRIELAVVVENKRAIALYEKNGFIVEGLMHKSIKIGRKYHDMIRMAKILK